MEWISIESANLVEVEDSEKNKQLKWYGNVYYRAEEKAKVYEVILTLSPKKLVYAYGGGKKSRTVFYQQLIHRWDDIQSCLKKQRLEYATGNFTLQNWDGTCELNDVGFVYPNKTYLTVQDVLNRKDD